MFIPLSLESSNNIYIKSGLEIQEVIFAMQLSDAAFTDYLLVRIFLIVWLFFFATTCMEAQLSHLSEHSFWCKRILYNATMQRSERVRSLWTKY